MRIKYQANMVIIYTIKNKQTQKNSGNTAVDSKGKRE